MGQLRVSLGEVDQGDVLSFGPADVAIRLDQQRRRRPGGRPLVGALAGIVVEPGQRPVRNEPFDGGQLPGPILGILIGERDHRQIGWPTDDQTDEGVCIGFPGGCPHEVVELRQPMQPFAVRCREPNDLFADAMSGVLRPERGPRTCGFSTPSTSISSKGIWLTSSIVPAPGSDT